MRLERHVELGARWIDLSGYRNRSSGDGRGGRGRCRSRDRSPRGIVVADTDVDSDPTGSNVDTGNRGVGALTRCTGPRLLGNASRIGDEQAVTAHGAS